MSKERFSGRYFVVTHTIEEDGELVIIGPDEIRSFLFPPGGYHERISIYFSSTVLSPLCEYELPLIQLFRMHTPGREKAHIQRKYSCEKMLPILEDICKLMQHSNLPKSMDSMPETDDSAIETSHAVLEARIHLLLLQLLFALYDAQENPKLPVDDYSNNSIIWDICRYIHENLAENLTYQHLQERFHVSRYQLTELFTRNTGISLTEYIIQKRLIKVTTLVRNGSGIEAAAFEAGFRNYSNFYKEFLKYHNISPRKYYANKNETKR